MKKLKVVTQQDLDEAVKDIPAKLAAGTKVYVPTVDLSTPAKKLAHLKQYGLGHIVNTNNIVSISPYPILVTPEMAQAFLQHNDANRQMQENNKERLRASLLRGMWELTIDGISFDFDGTLTNGQTRLEAISKSGVAAYLVVGFGFKQAKEMDTGAKRTAWDVIHMMNIGKAPAQDKKIVGTVRAMLRRHIRGGGSATNAEIIEAYEEWMPYLVDMSSIICSHRVGDVWMNAALVAAYMNGVPLADIEEFKREYAAENSQAPEHKIILDLRMQNRINMGGGSDENYVAKYRGTQYALQQFVNRTGQTTVPFGLTQDIWEYDTLFLNKDKDGNVIQKRYYR